MVATSYICCVKKAQNFKSMVRKFWLIWPPQPYPEHWYYLALTKRNVRLSIHHSALFIPPLSVPNMMYTYSGHITPSVLPFIVFTPIYPVFWVWSHCLSAIICPWALSVMGLSPSIWWFFLQFNLKHFVIILTFCFLLLIRFSGKFHSFPMPFLRLHKTLWSQHHLMFPLISPPSAHAHMSIPWLNLDSHRVVYIDAFKQPALSHRKIHVWLQ